MGKNRESGIGNHEAGIPEQEGERIGAAEMTISTPSLTLDETTSHSTRLQTTAAKSLVIPLQGGGDAMDKYHGHGGSYTIDAATQTRKPNTTSINQENAS